MWKPWEHIYLMAPTEDVQQGEYGLVHTTFLKELPQLEYFKQRPGRSCLIMDDIHLHSHSTAKKDGAASQAELLERICGHMSTHHDGGLSVFIALQVWTGIPPKVRMLVGYCGTKKRYLHRLRTTHDGLTSLQFEPLKIDLFT